MSQKFLSEINLQALNNATTDTDKFLVSDSGTIKYRTGAEVLSDIGGQAALTNPVTGTGTTNYVPKFTGATSLENSQIFDNGTNVGIGTTSPSSKLHVIGKCIFDIGAAGSGDVLVVDKGSGGNIAFNINGIYSGQIGAVGSGDLYIASKSTYPAIVVKDGGNVGIGTTAPNEKLTVSGKIYANPQQPVVLSGLGAPYYGTNITLSSDIGSTQGANRIWSRYDGTGRAAMTFETNTTTQSYNSDPQSLSYTETMRITGNGNVGIGTTSPSNSKLVVSGASASGGIMSVDTSSTTSFVRILGDISSQNLINWQDGTSLRFATSTQAFGSFAERMRITAAGKIGIGTSNPSSRFTVEDSTAFSWGFPSVASAKIGTPGTGGSFLVMTPSLNSSYESGFAVDGTYSGGKSVINLSAFGVYSGGPYSADIAFKTATNTTLSEKMRITNEGNIGIGTTSPTYRTEIVRTGSGIQNLLSLKNLNQSVGVIDGVRLNLRDFNIESSSTYGSSNNILTIGISTSKQIALLQNGNVGIGTTSPSQKLDVAGDALINQLTIGQGPVVSQGNTALGREALGSMVSGSYNIAVGFSSNSDNDATGLTTIGAELNTNTNLGSLEHDCLAISQYNSNAATNQVPHIYAPKPINIPNGATTDVITFDVSHYVGAFVDYVIYLNNGSDYAMGTVYMAWKSSGGGTRKDVRQLEWADMSDFIFSLGGSGTTLTLDNTSGSDAWVRITVRGMMTN